MSLLNSVIGLWEVVASEPEATIEGQKGIIGTRLELTKLGEVLWTIPDGTVSIPFFNWDTYEVVARSPFLNHVLLRFGTYRGHIIEFHVDTTQSVVGVLGLRNDLCLIQCKRIGDSHEEQEIPQFSFLPALEDGYFTDLDIISENNKVFKAHTCILKMSAPALDWSAQPPPLSGLPEDVLGTALHYLYAQCIPADLHAKTAEKVVMHMTDIPALQQLQAICESYLNHLNFKTQILDILGEVQACAVRMTENFSGRNMRYDPTKFCLAVKRAARDAAVANTKLLLLSQLYNRRKADLTLGAAHEVIGYIQSRGPAVLGQLKGFLLGLAASLGTLQASQRQDLACYLVPEVEVILDTAASLLIKINSAVEVILKQEVKEEEEQSRLDVTSLEKKVNCHFHKKELMRFRSLLQRIGCLRKQLVQRKEYFRMLSTGNKIRSLSRNLEQMIEELPVFMLRLEEISDALDHKFEWNVSQFCFKVATAKVGDLLRKLVREKESIKDLMVELCQLVESDSFSQSLVALGLLDAEDVPTIHPADQKTDLPPPTHSGQMLNLTESFSISPAAQNSPLSKAAEELFNQGTNTDMVFEVVEAGCVTRLPAHRVIVAARCDWFRRALLSGMQEDIQRRIEVHDSNPNLFSKFLLYLYTGQLGSTALSGDQLAELLLLSDRYEVDSLKKACEVALRPHIEIESVTDLLILADQFNASILKRSCMQFIHGNPSVLDEDNFSELPSKLQMEVYDWVKPSASSVLSRRNLVSTSSIRSLSDRTANMHLSACVRSPEDLDEAVRSLQEIVGANVPRSRLESVVLATNFDLNRALDLFYISHS